MTAPDRIWAWTYKDCDWKSAWTVDDEDAPPHAVEYIRADPATPAAMTPEVRALIYAAKAVMHDLCHGNGLEGLYKNRDRLEVALSAFEGDA